jgi:hypothetical protein
MYVARAVCSNLVHDRRGGIFKVVENLSRKHGGDFARFVGDELLDGYRDTEDGKLAQDPRTHAHCVYHKHMTTPKCGAE